VFWIGINNTNPDPETAMWIAAALLVASAASCEVPAGEVTAQLGLDYEAFDSVPAPYGWRFLLQAKCTDSAVGLLIAYSKANAFRLEQAQALEMRFHVGQALAMSGRETEAIPHFEQALAPDAAAEWRTYVEATLAFLKHDRATLEASRDAYARIAPASMRLRIIDGMLACPSEAYSTAIHCRM
jgi:hypothetical protein